MSQNITLTAGKYSLINPAMAAEAITLKCAGVKPDVSSKEDAGVDDAGNVIKTGRNYLTFTAKFYPFYTWEETNSIQQGGQLLSDLNKFKNQKYLWITDIDTVFLDAWRIINDNVTYSQIAISTYLSLWKPFSVEVASEVCTVIFNLNEDMPITVGSQINFDANVPDWVVGYFTVLTYGFVEEGVDDRIVITFSSPGIADTTTPAMSSAARGIVYIATSAPHGLADGESAYITGSLLPNGNDYNGSFPITYLGTNTFTVPVTLNSNDNETATTTGVVNVSTDESNLAFPISVEMGDWSSTSNYPSGQDELEISFEVKSPYSPTEIG